MASKAATGARSDRVSDGSFSSALSVAAKRALGGGLAGAAAMALQVLTLMPLRTTMNVQYRYGGTAMEAARKLAAEGGFTRFYRGLGPALIQAPLSRFGDTAANAGALALLDGMPGTVGLPIAVKTAAASVLAAGFRILLVPVDTLKTMMQVEGAAGLPALRAKVRAHGPSSLFHGAMASAAATAAGHFPWFATFNTLNEWVPQQTTTPRKLVRNAAIGFTATVVSDTISNSLRVLKTYRQTHKETVTYRAAAAAIVANEGIGGLLWRGLRTRLLANGLQGLLFSVLWRLFEDALNGRSSPRGAATAAATKATGAGDAGIATLAAVATPAAQALPALRDVEGQTAEGGGNGSGGDAKRRSPLA